MIRGIFFDFDGVITVEKMGTPTIVSYIAKETGLSLERVETAYRRHNKLLLHGDITHEDMWGTFCEEVGMDIDYSILLKSFLNVTIDRTIVSYMRELKKNYIIGMITDNKVDRIETILENTELKNLFDAVIISAGIHAQKTDSKIFEEALRAIELNPAECVFIDNTAMNLEVPSKMGFQTILFDDDKRDIAEFKDRLSKILGKETV